ncbi:MAG: hypothetical protein M1379_16905 [Firmicutes bacterium]|nr:hypothetical protein [Bacillota bacterium]
MEIPSFMLSGLYVKGSLRNTDAGVAFRLKNSLAAGTVTEVSRVKLGDTSHPLSDVVLKSGDTAMKASEITPQNSVAFGVNVVLEVLIPGAKLPVGVQKLDLAASTKEYGALNISVKDVVK